MKKFLLLSWMFSLSMAVLADGGKIDGSGIRKITFNGDQVVIEYTNGTTTTGDMAEVTIDMSGATSIEERVAITTKAGIEGQAVYDLKGQKVGNSAARLTKGVYIIGNKKVVVK